MVTFAERLYRRTRSAVIGCAVLGLVGGGSAWADEPPKSTGTEPLPAGSSEVDPAELAKLRKESAFYRRKLAERERAAEALDPTGGESVRLGGKIVLGVGVGGGLLAIGIGLGLTFAGGNNGPDGAQTTIMLCSVGGGLVVLGLAVGIPLLLVGNSRIDKSTNGGAMVPWIAPVFAGRTVDGAVGGVAVRF